jgi:response regulator RpfG family c-di-GMP phosphodiesterase
MNNGGDRLDRIEHIQEQVAKDLAEVARTLKEVAVTQQEVVAMQREMAARQQYHDDAFERFDAEMKVIKEAVAVDGENIRALARIAELHNRRFEDLEGGGRG